MVVLRPYRPSDLDALYSICLQTGDSGQDATALHNDPSLIGHIYSAPYGVLEPEHVLVAEDDEGVGGYIVGTHDTDRFSERLERDWWPALRQRYAEAEGLTDADRRRIEAIRQPDKAPAELVTAYPAHIHMNLLPRLRGQRIGTRLLDLWVEQARSAGVTGIHLGAGKRNQGGIAFWSKFFTRLQDGDAVWFGRTI
jgi:GNAT superfamily N-acetyltransferase